MNSARAFETSLNFWVVVVDCCNRVSISLSLSLSLSPSFSVSLPLSPSLPLSIYLSMPISPSLSLPLSLYFLSLSSLFASLSKLSLHNAPSASYRSVPSLIFSSLCLSSLVIAWIPSHVGISGNEKADRLAKAALTSSLAAHSQVCWSDLKPRVDTYICTAWQALWNNETSNKLYEIRPNLKESLCNTTQSLYRKQETVITRLRIGHTWITHSYLLKKED